MLQESMSNNRRYIVGPSPYSTLMSTQEYVRVHGSDPRWSTDINGLHAFMVPGRLYKINTPRGCCRTAKGNEYAYFIDLIQLPNYKLLNAGTPFMYLGYDTVAQVAKIVKEKCTRRLDINGDVVGYDPSAQSIKERAEFIKILLLGDGDVCYVRPIIGDMITEISISQ